jgi:hypothetical protein
MQKPPVNQRDYTDKAHFLYRALLKITIKKPNLAFLVVQPSLINIERNQTILPGKRTEVFVRIGEFFRQVSWLLLHHLLNAWAVHIDFTPIMTGY